MTMDADLEKKVKWRKFKNIIVWYAHFHNRSNRDLLKKEKKVNDLYFVGDEFKDALPPQDEKIINV